MTVNLVGDDRHLVLVGDPNDFRQVFPGEVATAGITRVGLKISTSMVQQTLDVQ